MTYPTYTWLAKDVPLGLSAEPWGSLGPNTKVLLYNGCRNLRLEIMSTSIQVLGETTTSATAPLPVYTISRVDSVLGGAPIAPLPFDSSSPLPSQVVGYLHPEDVGGDVTICTRSIVVAGLPNNVAGVSPPLPPLRAQVLGKGASAVVAPIVINPGEGVAITKPDAMSGMSNWGGFGPLTVSCTVVDVATGATSLFCADYVGFGVSKSAMCVFNGAGSGVVLLVTNIEISCAALNHGAITPTQYGWYIADSTAGSDDPRASDDTASIIPYDSARALPAGIVAWRGELHNKAGNAWLSKATEVGRFVPALASSSLTQAAQGDSLIGSRVVNGRRATSQLLPSPPYEPASKLPISIPTGSGLALGSTHLRTLPSTYYTTWGALGMVADVEIVFRVRPRVARRIIGATSIRGVA